MSGESDRTLVEVVEQLSDDEIAAEVHAFDREWTVISREYEIAKRKLEMYLTILRMKPEAQAKRDILWKAWITELSKDEAQTDS